MMNVFEVFDMNDAQYRTWCFIMDCHDGFISLEEVKMTLDIPTLTENIEEIRKHIYMLNGEVAYYLSIAQNKIDDIDELDRVICDLQREFEDQYAEEGDDYRSNTPSIESGRCDKT